MRARTVLTILLTVSLINVGAGSLTTAKSPAPLAFDHVRKTALAQGAVRVENGDPGDGVLVLKIAVQGDSPPVGLKKAKKFLEKRLGVRVVEDPRGAPVVFTQKDLLLEGKAGPIGAAISRGAVVEVRNPDLAPCVVAHEIGHMLGLDHTEEASNFMYARCDAGRLAPGAVADHQRRAMASIHAIHHDDANGTAKWAWRDAR